ncbi:hypothetical protein [Nannocystis pusilla]|uniref:hypothetical protein n=1 Tax=Nannocystis pusilla TaxID=889268 RepID=UPI003B7F7E99
MDPKHPDDPRPAATSSRRMAPPRITAASAQRPSRARAQRTSPLRIAAPPLVRAWPAWASQAISSQNRGLADVDLDLDPFDLDPDDLDLDECFDLGFDLETDCEVVEGLECLAQCDPLAVQLACVAELGWDADLQLFAACAAELTSECIDACADEGALFCDGDVAVYVGPSSCL